MPNDSANRIMLLPKDQYWAWVGAAKDYAVRFGVTLTPTPQNAARFHYPKQVISVVSAKAAYSAYGDMVGWLRSEVPTVALDIIAASSPDELQTVLDERIARGDVAWILNIEAPTDFEDATELSITPTTLAPAMLQLHWPTDYPEILQGFGDNPDIYRRFGFPGHEGVDFKAPLNSNVYACADGQVYHVNDGSAGHPYGIHVQMSHPNGYSTIYAHLNQALVGTGQIVRAGELIGLANSTGNATSSHLHLTLKKDGATESGLTQFPNDIIDPSPFLLPMGDARTIAGVEPDWAYGRCLIGLHGRVGGEMQESDWEITRTARIEALKLTTLNPAEDVDKALSVNPAMFILVRLVGDLSRRTLRAMDFVQHVEPNLSEFYDRGVRYFEVHNEPNLAVEGFGHGWRSGAAFGDWFMEVVGMLKPLFPEAKFGWPGLSPGTTEGMRFDYHKFLESAYATIEQVDWIGCHCYWQSDRDLLTSNGGLSYEWYRQQWPDKLLFITEFSNTLPSADFMAKARQYHEYYHHLREVPGIGAAFSFAVSAAANYPYETWRYETGEPTPIASIVGARSFE